MQPGRVARPALVVLQDLRGQEQQGLRGRLVLVDQRVLGQLALLGPVDHPGPLELVAHLAQAVPLVRQEFLVHQAPADHRVLRDPQVQAVLQELVYLDRVALVALRVHQVLLV